jgi:hypothetical protein
VSGRRRNPPGRGAPPGGSTHPGDRAQPGDRRHSGDRAQPGDRTLRGDGPPPRSGTPPARGPAPGLCGVCVHARVIVSGKGSRFYMCGLSSVDARFPKYPRLPVLECAGFERVEGSWRE